MSEIIYIVTELYKWNGLEGHETWAYRHKKDAENFLKERADKWQAGHDLRGYSVEQSGGLFECYDQDGPDGDHFCIWVQPRCIL